MGERMNREEILNEAIKCVCGQREQDYGTPENNFQTIANLWSTYLGCTVKAIDVTMMMALLKIARIRNGGGSGDSFVDLAGYAACGGELKNDIAEKALEPLAVGDEVWYGFMGKEEKGVVIYINDDTCFVLGKHMFEGYVNMVTKTGKSYGFIAGAIEDFQRMRKE
jgi:hypothetical protein